MDACESEEERKEEGAKDAAWGKYSRKRAEGRARCMGASWLLKLSRGGGDAREAQIRDKASSERRGWWRRLGGYHKWRSSLPPNNISYLNDKFRTILR